MVMTMYLSIVARVLLDSRDVFVQVCIILGAIAYISILSRFHLLSALQSNQKYVATKYLLRLAFNHL